MQISWNKPLGCLLKKRSALTGVALGRGPFRARPRARNPIQNEHEHEDEDEHDYGWLLLTLAKVVIQEIRPGRFMNDPEQLPVDRFPQRTTVLDGKGIKLRIETQRDHFVPSRVVLPNHVSQKRLVVNDRLNFSISKGFKKLNAELRKNGQRTKESEAYWITPEPRTDLQVWTDDYSNLLAVFRWPWAH